LRAVAEGAAWPDALVLSAPMLGFLPDWLPGSFKRAFAALQCRLGDPRRPAWKWSEKPGEVPLFRQALLTHDDERYADELFWRRERPELVMGPGSWGWVRASLVSLRLLARPGVLEAVGVPVHLLATTADRLVGVSAIRRAEARLPHVDSQWFAAEAAHEILREVDVVRDRALEGIDRFLESIVPQ
jgi:lysophospholipase